MLEHSKRFISLKTRITFTMLVPIILSYVLIFVIVFIPLFNTLQDAASAEFLQISQKYASDFENRINIATNYLSLVSNTFELRVHTNQADRERARETVFNAFDTFWLIDGSSVYFEPNQYDGRDADYIGTEFGTDKSGRICWYFYKDGGVTAYLPESLQDDLEFELSHYTKAKEANKPVYTDPAVYEIAGRTIPMFTITYPINDASGEFIGAITVDLFLEDIYEQLQNEAIFETGYIIITNDEGNVIYSPVYEDIGRNRFEAGVGFNYPSGDEKFAYSNARSVINGKECFVTTQTIYIEQLDCHFYISVAAPTAEINAEGTRLIVNLVTLKITIAVLITLLLFYRVNKISEPIRALTANTKKIANGDTIAAAALIESDRTGQTEDEVHILRAAIVQMLSQLDETQNLKREKDKAQAQAQAKSDFLARMSHEIRTPMNAVIGITELILREEIPPRAYEYALSIKNAGNNLLSLINDILDFSKIESGKLEIVPVEYTFASLINDVINIIRVKKTDTSLFFVVNLNSAIPSQMIGDEVRFRQILINLLNNAVKYTHDGFIAMTVDSEITDNTVVLNVEIADSGIGIKPEDMDRLFKDFTQFDLEKNKDVQGTGLGLAITRSLCVAMGGDISVYSRYGEGTTFTVRLPQRIEHYEPFATVSNPSEKRVLLYEARDIYADSIACSVDNLNVECVLVQSEDAFREELQNRHYPFVFVSSFLFKEAKKIIETLGAEPSLVLLAEYGEVVAEKNIKTIAMPVHSISIANILNDVTDNAGYGGSLDAGISFSAPSARVLIVDDIVTNLQVAEGLMAPYNMRIDVCISGEAALELVANVTYDLVFMDHMMPGMDGIETVRRIRAMGGAYAKLPIIALTANAISGVREMFLQNGMNDFLSKPIEVTKLNNVLEQWLPREKRENLIQRDVKPATYPTVLRRLVIEGVDVPAGVKATGGDADRYCTTLSLFRKDGVEKMLQLQQCLENNDIRLYTTYVHALKSALFVIGARALSERAKKLEAAGLENDMTYIGQHGDNFMRALEKLLAHIDAALSVVSVEKTDENTAENRAEQNQMLTALRHALDEMDATLADELVDALRARNQNSAASGAIEDIYRNILLFEYEAAQSIIDELLQ